MERCCVCIPQEVQEILNCPENKCAGCRQLLKSNDNIYIVGFYYGCSARYKVIHFATKLFHTKCTGLVRMGEREMICLFENGIVTPKQTNLHAKIYWKAHVIEMDRCAHCGLMDQIKKCKGCLRVKYCSTKCQNEDWKIHKLNCKKKN